MNSKPINTPSVCAAATVIVLMLAAGIARSQQSTFFNEVMSLNPAGYWPMHETNLPAVSDAGDIETNYGTLGVLGNGYYPDWEQNLGEFSRGVAGPLSGSSGSDMAVHFTHANTSGNTATTWTNVLYIPHTSPLTTLIPPFTVEMWYYPTSTTSLYIWGQFGYAGLNAGAEGTGVGSWNGIGLNYNGSFVLYPNANGAETTLIGSSALADNHWYYLVVTCDSSTNMALWTNGVQVGSSTSAVGKYLPDYWTPLTIGGSRGNSRTCNGTISEFAVYTNVLQPGDIAAHYSDGNSLGAGQYFNDVTASNPAIYLRMNAPAYTAPAPGNWLTVGNSGTTNGTAVGGGVFSPGTMPGVMGGPINIGGKPFGGVTNNSALLSGVSSFADVGNAPVYNPTGGAPFSVSVLFRGHPCDNRVQSIVGHGTNSWELTVTTNGCVVFNSGTNSTAIVATGQGVGDLVSTNVLNDGNWHFVVAAHNGATNMLFVDGLLNNWATNAATNTLGNSRDVLIGSDPNYTNSGNAGNLAGVGWQFAGQICDVAFFTNALTLGQVQTLYSACQVAPVILGQPQSYSINAGIDFTNMEVTVNGSAPLSYQWYTNGVALAGQTAPNLILNPVTVNESSSNYYVIVTNDYGSATSAVASLTVIGPPSFTNTLPVTYDVSNNTNYLTLYAGVNPTFKAVAAGAQPIVYYWYTNGVNIAGQTGTNFALTDVQVGTINVACVASNFVGTNTIVWSASVIADPLNGANPAPYPQQVLAGNPIGYWRMNDYGMDGDNESGDDGYVAHDYAGGNDGLYTNVYLDNSSYSSTDPSDTSVFLGDFGNSFPNTANNFAGWIEGIDFATANGTNAEFTVEAWAQGVIDQQSDPAAIVTQGKYGVSDAFNLGLDSQSAHHYQFYVRSAAGTEYTVDSTLAPDGNWHHLAGVCDEANGVISLYVDGHLQSTAAIPKTAGLFEANAPLSIGAGTADGVNYAYQFLGGLNDIAVFDYALTASNVASQYVSLGSAPVVSPAPQATADVNGGGTLVVPAAAVGTPVSGYYWTDENAGTNVAAGTTSGPFLNATLTVSNVPGSWNGDTLQLTVTNAYGQNTYSVALTVNTNAPIITLQLPTPVTVLQGNSYTYTIGADGVAPLSYQWYDGATAISNATNASYTVMAGAPGSTTYSVKVTNPFGDATSAGSQFISVSSSRPALTSGYGTNVMLLNPAGYWPMHETQSPAVGDIEANCGRLGILGTGYYPDWATNGGGITRNYSGALPYDPDASVFFNDNIGTGSTLYWTNELYIPLNSPQTTLNPPFTVECWCLATNTGGGQDVWAQFGDEGFEAGNEGGTSGGYDGIQMVYNGSFTVYGEYNGTQTGMLSSPSVSTDVWVYLVVTCDSGTNFNFYLNGTNSPAGTYNGVQKYTPDYWTPITIGGGRGGTRSFAGAVDEFAIYTNVLQPGDIAAHYNAGLNAGPGQYFADVMASNPAIYFRMDAPNYTPPSTNFWPVLFNYGSVGNNGLYTPGTMPGVMAGPSANTTTALTGVSGNVPMLSGVSSFADAGYASAFNPTGCQPFSVTAMFKGNPCDDRFQDIVGHSDASWRIAMNFNGHLQCTLGTNSSSTINSFKAYNDTNWHQAVEVYTPASNPNLPGTNSLYVDGVLDTNIATVSTNGILPGVVADVMIGSDPEYTNNPAGLGRNFAGQVCEVALFTNALNAGEVGALYAAAVNPNAVPAYVAPEPPLSVTVAPGATLNLTAGAAGTSAVGYTWQINTNGGGTSVLSTGTGAAPLNANLTVSSVPIAWNGGLLQLTVTNTYGTNIAFVNLAVVNPVSTVPPGLGFALTNSQLTLSWPPDHLGWTLEAQTNSLDVGLSNNWTQVVGSTGVTNITIPINLTNGTVFYRLMYP